MTSSTAKTADAARPTGTRVPDFFVIGHPKCGTTAMYEMLRRHPGIFMPELKEPWFLASDLRPRFPPPRSASPPQSVEQYLGLFADARPDQLAGEASSAYLLSHTSAREIAALRPDARMIAILREPASFVRSLHLQLLRTHVESKQSLRQALALEDARREGRKIPRRSHRPQLLMYSDHVRYVEQLRRYRDVFGADQLLVLIYDDFRDDNEGTIRRVLRFLDLDAELPVSEMEANRTVARMRSQQLDELLNIVSVGRGPASRALKAAIKTLTPQALRKRAIETTQRRVINGTPTPPDEELMAELRIRFKPEVQALSDYIGRDLLALWGYEGP